MDEKEEMQKMLEVLKELEVMEYEKGINTIVFRIVDQNKEVSSVLVSNVGGLPEEYIDIPNGEYSHEEYEALKSQ